MSARIKKETKPLNCKLEKKIVDDLENFCKETGLNKTVTTERALAAYFERYRQTKEL